MNLGLLIDPNRLAAALGIGGQRDVLVEPAARPVFAQRRPRQRAERPIAEDPFMAIQANDRVVGQSLLLERQPLGPAGMFGIVLLEHDQAEAHARLPLGSASGGRVAAINRLDAAEA